MPTTPSRFGSFSAGPVVPVGPLNPESTSVGSVSDGPVLSDGSNEVLVVWVVVGKVDVLVV